MAPVDVASYKEVLGHYATGIVVVAVMNGDGPVGFTCQSFGSLSLEPTLVTFAASSAGHSWARVRAHDVVGVSVLGADQEAIARRFATSGLDKFDGTPWEKGPAGAPLLEGAIAHLEGTLMVVSSHGDHDVAVVEVTYARAHSGRPLIYFRGGFAELA